MYKFIALLVLLIIGLCTPITIFASDSFDTFIHIHYDLRSDGKVHVKSTIDIQNLTSEKYAPEFIYQVHDIPLSALTITEGKDSYILEPKNKDKVAIVFKDPVLGLGKTKTFSIEFDSDSLLNKNGQIWELTIPKINEDETLDKIDTIVTASPELGELLYMNPEGVFSFDNSLREYRFKGALSQGITAGFGKNQVYFLDLTYHLVNTKPLPNIQRVALPPDTSTQRIYYTALDPKPSQIIIDVDGNWLAEYKLSGNSRIDVKAQGYAKLSPQAVPFRPLTNHDDYLSTSGYWAVSDELSDLAKKLATPENIFNYVSSNLHYDYGRVGPESERLGAIKALSDPTHAICTEYTDTFIALTRAAGIPAREINGYAYTENSKIKPLSLVSDILHAWPEYWESEKNTWVPVDPTWTSTTGGLDFFNGFDLKHVAFVIHGVDQENPLPPGSYKLPGNSQKDVFVSPTDKTFEPQKSVAVTLNASPTLIGKNKYSVVIENTGNTALYSERLKLYNGGELLDEIVIGDLPPYANFTVPIPSKDLHTRELTLSLLNIEEKHTLNSYNISIMIRNGFVFVMTLCLVISLFIKRRSKTIYDEDK